MKIFRKNLILKTTTILLLFFLFFFFICTNAKAETEVEYPSSFGTEPTKSLPEYIKYIYQFAVGISGFLAMLMLIIGGFRLMTAAGDPGRLYAAKNQIINSITGLLLILFSAFIIGYLNPDLLILHDLSLKNFDLENDLETMAKEYKEQNQRTRGGSTSNLRIGAVYDTGSEINCYTEEDFWNDEEEENAIIKDLISGDQTSESKDLDGNKNHIFCCIWDYSTFEQKENEAGEAVREEREIDWEEEDFVKCEKKCDLGSSSCPKIEGDQDGCEQPVTCAKVKELGLKSDCNNNYIYCLTHEPPPPPSSGSGGGSSGESNNKESEEGVTNVGCQCDHTLQGPPNNGYTCPNSPETSGYCAVYEVCFKKKCYDLRENGRCFCTDNSNYKCLRDTTTPEGIRMIETIKTGGCGGSICSGITNYPTLPCTGGSGHIPD